jgi:hypothetical protein
MIYMGECGVYCFRSIEENACLVIALYESE